MRTWATAPLFVLGLGALMATNATAITTIGARSCGQWVDARAKPQSFASIAAETWLVGFMSGLAMGTDKDILADADAPSLYLWVDNYCKNNPLDRVPLAAVNLFDELRRRKGP